MAELNENRTIQDNQVVTLDYTLKVDGGVVDTSENDEPIVFIQGQGQIVPGLEQQLYGMAVGESKEIVVQPADGYGDVDQSAYAEVPRDEFPDDIPLETGVALQLRDEDDEVMDAYIAAVGDETVRLNFNHPLAGKELYFSVTVLDLRDATDVELSHGHVHEEGIYADEDEIDGDWVEGEDDGGIAAYHDDDLDEA